MNASPATSRDAAQTIDAAPSFLPDEPVATTRGRGWGGLTADFYGPGVYDGVRTPAWDHHLVCVNLAGVAQLTQTRRGGRHSAAFRPGAVTVLPAGIACLWEGRTTPSARLRLEPGLLGEAARQLDLSPGAAADVRDLIQGEDEALLHYASLLRVQAQGPSHPAQAVIVESLSCAISAHVLSRFCGAQGRAAQRPALSPAVLLHLQDLIESRLRTGVRLDDLAAAAGLSRFQVSRAFARAMGVGPIAYLEHRRVRRAMELIAQGGLSLAEIGLELGFADQSHFTRAFRRRAGATPAAFARACRRPRAR